MRTTTVRISLVALAAIMLALLVAAIAVAQPGDDGETGREATPTGTPAASSSPSEEASAQPTAEPTEAPTDAAPEPTDEATPEPADVEDDATEAEGDEEGDPAVGTTIATNPGGHCVELPNDSDVVGNPDKHPNWKVGVCDPREDPEPGPDGEDPPNDDGGPPEGRTPSLNPDGVCVALPNNSDIVRNPDKHPKWVVGGCDTPTE